VRQTGQIQGAADTPTGSRNDARATISIECEDRELKRLLD
jgi:hypothetical protein